MASFIINRHASPRPSLPHPLESPLHLPLPPLELQHPLRRLRQVATRTVAGACLLAPLHHPLHLPQQVPVPLSRLALRRAVRTGLELLRPERQHLVEGQSFAALAAPLEVDSAVHEAGHVIAFLPQQLPLLLTTALAAHSRRLPGLAGVELPAHVELEQRLGLRPHPSHDRSQFLLQLHVVEAAPLHPESLHCLVESQKQSNCHPPCHPQTHPLDSDRPLLQGHPVVGHGHSDSRHYPCYHHGPPHPFDTFNLPRNDHSKQRLSADGSGETLHLLLEGVDDCTLANAVAQVGEEEEEEGEEGVAVEGVEEEEGLVGGREEGGEFEFELGGVHGVGVNIWCNDVEFYEYEQSLYFYQKQTPRPLYCLLSSLSPKICSLREVSSLSLPISRLQQNQQGVTNLNGKVASRGIVHRARPENACRQCPFLQKRSSYCVLWGRLIGLSILKTQISTRMLVRVILACLLLAAALGQNCNYNDEEVCIDAGCVWTEGGSNSTTNSSSTNGSANTSCSVSPTTPFCLGNQVYYAPWQECVTCSSLAASNCSTICTTYYFSSQTNTCLDCGVAVDPECIVCSSAMACTTCADGFTPDANSTNICIDEACNISRCVDCFNSTVCEVCGVGFRLSSNAMACEAATCSIRNCLNCDETECGVCQEGFLRSDDWSSCTLICDDPDCASCTTASICDECYEGYAVSQTTKLCQLVCDVDNCEECSLLGRCEECADGYSPSSDYTRCLADCNDQNCFICSPAETCTVCDTGYTLNGNACELDLCSIEYCQTCNTAITCGDCQEFTTLSSDNLTCTPNCVSSSTELRECLICASDTTCAFCELGYVLSTDGTACTQACSIANCQLCISANLCLFCEENYLTNSALTACVINCGIQNCRSCNSTTTCGTCFAPYTAEDGGATCERPCPANEYLTANDTCATCATAIAECATCISATVCSTCYEFFYLANSGECELCEDSITGCLFCSSATKCTLCQDGFALKSDGTCATQGECNVDNCLLCTSGNAASCEICDTGYTLASATSCTEVTCSITGQFFSAEAGKCACPDGTFKAGGVCSVCSDPNCVECTSAGCTECEDGFFPLRGACQSCSSNCISCTTASRCLECDIGYGLESGSCVAASSFNGVALLLFGGVRRRTSCPPGCRRCNSGQGGAVICRTALRGYSFNTLGRLVRCDNNCRSCSPSNTSHCTSCYRRRRLVGRNCVNCQDPNAVTCTGNRRWSDSCIPGYTPVSGLCTACAENCLSCGITGAGKCDNGGCGEGYVKIQDTTNCTQCLQGCASCSTRSPAQCLSCPPGQYLTNSSSCDACATGCNICTSASVCTTCLDTHVLQSNVCYTRAAFPCSAQSGETCTACYLGYTLSGSTCSVDTSCNNNSSCVICPVTTYLSNGQCLACTTDSGVCDHCDEDDPSVCKQCVDGYFLSGTTCTRCSSVTTGCVQCSASDYCTQAATGYFLRRRRGQYTGAVRACATNCATCVRFPACRTCLDNYVKRGARCVFTRRIRSIIVFNPLFSWFTTGNTASNEAGALLRLNFILFAFLDAAGTRNPDQIACNSLRSGSITTDTEVSASPSDDINTFSNNFLNNINTGGVGGMSIVSSSSTVEGSTTTSEDNSANLGLILGVSIPLVILLVVIIIFIKINTGEKDTYGAASDYSQKEMYDQQL